MSNHDWLMGQKIEVGETSKNVIILKMLGCVPLKRKGGNDNALYRFPWSTHSFVAEHAAICNNWNRIMKIINQIEHYGYSVMILENMVIIRHRSTDEIFCSSERDTKIKAAFDAIFEFSVLYNRIK